MREGALVSWRVGVWFEGKIGHSLVWGACACTTFPSGSSASYADEAWAGRTTSLRTIDSSCVASWAVGDDVREGVVLLVRWQEVGFGLK